MLTTIIKKVLSVLPDGVERSLRWHHNRSSRQRKLNDWNAAGNPVPPPHQYKQVVVEEVATKHKLNILVETGTFLGHMLEAQRKNFKKIYSIELDQKLYGNAKKYFSNFKHISIVQGDSSVMLSGILDELGNNPVLFWLDGHYCGDNTGLGDKQCPIFEELDTIFAHGISDKYILIDDARCFNGTNDYPTIPELIEYVRSIADGFTIMVANDIIHIFKH